MKRKPTESLREQILRDLEDYEIMKQMYYKLGIDIEEENLK